MAEQATENETVDLDGEGQAPPPPQQTDDEQAPPWGTDEEFDPEKAWKLIQNLRKEKDDLKPLAEKARQLEDAQKSDQQKLQDALEAAQTEGATAKAQAAKLTAALEHGLSKDDLELLDGVPADQIAERAARLAERLKPNGAPPASRNQGGDGGSPDVNHEQLAEQLWNRHRI